MLGSKAAGIFWMFRDIERMGNTARLIDAGMRIALTRSTAAEDEWTSVVATAGAQNAFEQRYGQYDATSVTDFLLRDRSYPSSVASLIESARNNARLVRTGITREVWEATNMSWMTLRDLLSERIAEADLPAATNAIKTQSAQVRGVLHGSMMRNEIYDFAWLGTFIERADNSARILDVKYHLLLPTAFRVGSWFDNYQWETILRCVSAQRGYRWQNPGEVNPREVSRFVILEDRMPRSMAFCFNKIAVNLSYLENEHGLRHPCHDMAEALRALLADHSIDSIFEYGLHEFLTECIRDTGLLAQQIEEDYRFNA